MTDPSPRISILQALANTSSFVSYLPKPQANGVNLPMDTNGNGSSPSTPKKRKSRHTETTEETAEANTEIHQKGDLGDLEVLYNLWKGAGKQVNLWDWLQGYKNHITGAGDDDGDEDGNDRIRADPMENGNGNGNSNEHENENAGRKRKHADEEVDEDRLHATFVRFCEEARMLGMVRARGKAVGRKADEVVKGVTLL